MKHLTDILYKVNLTEVQGSTDVEVTDVQIDSRKVAPGSVFIAVSGVAVDGHQFIEKAVENGAVAILYETSPAAKKEGVTYIQVVNSAQAAGIVAHNFYDQPSVKARLVGVTGTNGKTTIATLLYKLYTTLGFTCGLVSTVENLVAGKVIPSTHTTPDAISLNKLLHDMVENNCSHIFMEVSSHAVHQNRIAGLQFDGAIFSNITHDHLDYHKTFDEYIKAKKAFFDQLPSTAFALTNKDDKRGEVMVQNTVAKKATYSLKNAADFKGKIIENDLAGLLMSVNGQEVHFRLIGEFNAYNLLAVYGASVLLGEESKQVLLALSNITGAEGRFDYSVSPKEKVIGIIDYAHTPDALVNVLSTVNKLRKGKVITVVGCGGDRDKTKRPVMAEAACTHSDKVIFTSDNPRSEDPNQIIADMEAGLNAAAKRKSVSIVDRRQAIKMAVDMANKGDIVLIAGKGHEKYQEINGVKHHFDDKEVLMEMFELMNK
jgi:UDP-N-acetylmuramoyl-L-alanyl-D-glutamate--2,6-diaminopimelate ligase